jgi:hypothetical protein
LKNSTVSKWTSCATSREGCTNWVRAYLKIAFSSLGY